MDIEYDDEYKIICTDDALNRTLDVAAIACVHGGEIFGGFVRDVILPRSRDSTCACAWKDIDIWFKSHADVEAFIKAASDKVWLLYPLSECGLYSFVRIRYALRSHDKGIRMPYIDVIIAESFPVNDLNVNNLRYRYQPMAFQRVGYGADALQGDDIDTCIDAIQEKRATLLPGYIALSKGDTDIEALNEHRAVRIYDRFMKRGWSIYAPDGITLLNNLFRNELESGTIILEWDMVAHKMMCAIFERYV